MSEQTYPIVHAGEIIRFKREWMDPGDAKYTFRAIETSGTDDSDVLYQADEHKNMFVVPTMSCRKFMIDFSEK